MRKRPASSPYPVQEGEAPFQVGPGLGEGLPQEGLGLVVGEVPEGLKGQGGVLPLGQRLQEGEPLPPPHLQKGLPQAEPGPGAAPPQEALPGRKLLRGDGEGDGAFQELEEFFLEARPEEGLGEELRGKPPLGLPHRLLDLRPQGPLGHLPEEGVEAVARGDPLEKPFLEETLRDGKGPLGGQEGEGGEEEAFLELLLREAFPQALEEGHGLWGPSGEGGEEEGRAQPPVARWASRHPSRPPKRASASSSVKARSGAFRWTSRPSARSLGSSG